MDTKWIEFHLSEIKDGHEKYLWFKKLTELDIQIDEYHKMLKDEGLHPEDINLRLNHPYVRREYMVIPLSILKEKYEITPVQFANKLRKIMQNCLEVKNGNGYVTLKGKMTPFPLSKTILDEDETLNTNRRWILRNEYFLNMKERRKTLNLDNSDNYLKRMLNVDLIHPYEILLYIGKITYCPINFKSDYKGYDKLEQYEMKYLYNIDISQKKDVLVKFELFTYRNLPFGRKTDCLKDIAISQITEDNDEIELMNNSLNLYIPRIIKRKNKHPIIVTIDVVSLPEIDKELLNILIDNSAVTSSIIKIDDRFKDLPSKYGSNIHKDFNNIYKYLKDEFDKHNFVNDYDVDMELSRHIHKPIMYFKFRVDKCSKDANINKIVKIAMRLSICETSYEIKFRIECYVGNFHYYIKNIDYDYIFDFDSFIRYLKTIGNIVYSYRNLINGSIDKKASHAYQIRTKERYKDLTKKELLDMLEKAQINEFLSLNCYRFTGTVGLDK